MEDRMTLSAKSVSLAEWCNSSKESGNDEDEEQPGYTLECKLVSVRLVDSGESIAAAARLLGVVDQTLFNWVKLHMSGKLQGADSKLVSAEQMEISRLRAVSADRNMTTQGCGRKLGLVKQRCRGFCGTQLDCGSRARS